MTQINIDPHWETWFRASIYKHFKDSLSSTYSVFVEEQEKSTNGKVEWLEIRMDGLFINRRTKREFSITFEVNVLINWLRPTTSLNIYGIHNISGKVESAFTDCITIRRYGPNTDVLNDGTVFTQALLRPRRRTEDVEKSFFGLVDSATSLYQASVEGHYISTVEG